MSAELYILSGLGADEKVFRLLDFGAHPVTFIKWTDPLRDEAIRDYAARLAEQISSPRPVLIGLSFGGIMAIEIAKQRDVAKVILLASAKTRGEIPWYYRLAGKLRLHKLVPVAVMKRPGALTNWFFGARSELDKKVLKQTLEDTDPVFLKWAIDHVVRWENQTIPKKVFHIHGLNDRILPAGNVKSDAVVKSGGHLMTLTEPGEVNRLLRLHLGE